METYWVKHYQPTDTNPFNQLAEYQVGSWSKSQLTDMIGASIIVKVTPTELFEMRLIQGLGEYHQSDDYEASFPSLNHRMVKRRLQFHLPDGKWLTKELDMKRLDIKEYVSIIKI